MEPTAPVRDRYDRLKLLGEGGAGRVWLAEDRFRGMRRVALKEALDTDPQATAALRREFTALASVRHPGLPEAFAFHADAGEAPCFSLEYIDGRTLTAHLRVVNDPDELFTLTAETLSALAFLHTFGWIHRDLKPDNLLVRHVARRGCRLSLVDFGLALQPDSGPRAERPAGTLIYMAPELFGGGPVSPGVDLFALGAVLHEAIHGEPPVPFDGSDVTGFIERARAGERTRSKLPAGLPSGVGAWLDALLAVDPAGRPAGAIEALARWHELFDRPFEIDDEARTLAQLDSGPPPGRDALREAIWQRLDDPAGPRLLFIAGEAGIGKSRLLRWLAVEGIRRDWRVTGPLSTGDRTSRGVAATLFDGEVDAADGGPTLVALDDAERALPDWVAALEKRARGRADDGVRWVVGVRPDAVRSRRLSALLTTDPEAVAVARVDVPPLDERGVEALLQQAAAHRADVPAEKRRWVTEQSKGNPAVVEALILTRAWERGRPPAPDERIRAGIRARVAGLAAAARSWIEALAVFGGEATVDEIDQLAEFVEGGADAADEVLGSGLLRSDGTRLSPQSELVRQTVLEGLPLAERRRLAVRAAALEQERTDREPSLERLARWWKLAGETDRAIDAAVELAEGCELRGDLHDEEAERWCRFALRLMARRDPDRPALRRRHADLLRRIGRSAEAARAYGHLARRAAADSERAQLLARRSEAFGDAGRPAWALRTGEQALEEARKSGGAADRAAACRALGHALVRHGRLEEARALFEESASAFEALEQSGDQARSLYAAALAAARLRRHDEAEALYDRVCDLARQEGDVRLEANVGTARASLDMRRWRLSAAIERLEATLVHTEQHRLAPERLAVLPNLAAAQLESGRLDAALRTVGEVDSLALRLGRPDPRAHGRLIRASALVQLGRPTEAVALIRETLDRQAGRTSSWLRGYLEATWAEALLEMPSPEPEPLARRIAALIEEHGSEPKLALAARVLEMERTASDDAEAFGRAREAFDLQAESSEAVLDPQFRIRADLALARHRMQAGDEERSRQAAERAAVLAGESELPALAARAWVIAAEALERQEQGAAGGELRRRAERSLERAAALIADEESRRNFLDREVFAAIRKRVRHLPSSGEDRLMAIYEMIRVLNSQTDPDRLLEAMLDMALEVVRAERGMILLRTVDDELTLRLARNLEKQTIEEATEFSRNVALQAGSGQAVLAVDTSADERLKALKSVSLFGIRSVICVPLRSRGDIIGAVYLDNRVEGALFREDDLRFLEAFADHAALALENAQIRQDLEQENRRLQVAARERVGFDNIIGRSEPMQQLYDLIPKVADSHLPVLIQGESGTGKELVARAIHSNGTRQGQAFLTENCAAIPETLLESELFGHVRGAFTGADRDRAGLFELAHEGTLFLDEVGDMPAPMQARLLRVLEEGELRRVGGDRKIDVDVRLLTATHRDLQEEVRAGRFREDLLYRLQVLVLQLPPLRERHGDIPLLVQHFLERISRERGRAAPRLRSAVLDLLERYPWPGNVRQLENLLQRMALLAGDAPITVDLIESDPGLRKTLMGERVDEPAIYSLEHNEREQIRQALQATSGNRARAARLLGISRATIFRKIKEYELS